MRSRSQPRVRGTCPNCPDHDGSASIFGPSFRFFLFTCHRLPRRRRRYRHPQRAMAKRSKAKPQRQAQGQGQPPPQPEPQQQLEVQEEARPPALAGDGRSKPDPQGYAESRAKSQLEREIYSQLHAQGGGSKYDFSPSFSCFTFVLLLLLTSWSFSHLSFCIHGHESDNVNG